MSARLASFVLPLAGLLLVTASARAQEAPPSAQVGSTVIVVVPPGPGGAPVVVQGPAQQAPSAPPNAYYPAPPGYYPAPQPPPGAYYPGPPYGLSPEPPPAPRPRTAFSAKLWAGPSYQRLYDVALSGVDFGMSLGGQRGVSGWYAEMEGIVGRTDQGLSTYQAWLGPTWEGKLDRLHLGVGVHFGWMGIARATDGPLMTGLGLGVFGFASFDIYQSDGGHTLYVAARMTGNWMDGGPSAVPLYGPSASLGWRY